MTKYYQISDENLKKVLTNSKKRIGEFLKNNRNVEFDSVAEIDADYAYPIVTDEFLKLGLNVEDAEKCTWEFMDDIYMGEVLDDYIESILKRYHIRTLNGKKISAPKKKQNLADTFSKNFKKML